MKAISIVLEKRSNRQMGKMILLLKTCLKLLSKHFSTRVHYKKPAPGNLRHTIILAEDPALSQEDIVKGTIFQPVAAFLVLCVVLVITTLVGMKRPGASSVLASSSAPVAQSGPASQWEYQTMGAKSPEELVAQANQGGTQSWEMVSAVHVLNTNRYQWVGFFKRLKR
jgi:hypothetical protein